jgi:hypothetical protein
VFILKKIFSRPSKPISIKFRTNHPSVKGIHNCTNNGPGPLRRGDNHKNAKWGGVIEKSSQKPLSQKSSYLHHYVDSSLFKSIGPQGLGGATIGKTIFKLKNPLQNQLANFNQNWYKSSLGEEN